MKRIFTFGVGQRHRGKYVIITGKTKEDCRNKMIEKHGMNWAFVNDLYMLDRIQKAGLTEL